MLHDVNVSKNGGVNRKSLLLILSVVGFMGNVSSCMLVMSSSSNHEQNQNGRAINVHHKDI